MDKKIYKEIDNGFENIIKIRSAIKKRIEDIEKIKHSIKQNYIECIEKESKNYFGLDSVHFQNKLIELEFENMLKLYSYIDNRIYGDYYKLFFMMNDYLQDKLLSKQYQTIRCPCRFYASGFRFQRRRRSGTGLRLRLRPRPTR